MTEYVDTSFLLFFFFWPFPPCVQRDQVANSPYQFNRLSHILLTSQFPFALYNDTTTKQPQTIAFVW